jgi:dihydroneopterin aldolase
VVFHLPIWIEKARIMTNETRLAFEHPEARAAAMSTEPLDRISLREHIVEVEIGAFQAERGVTQRLAFNVAVEVSPLPPDLDDDVDRILSYDRVTEAIAFELAAERLNLLETLAERIADRILQEPQAERCFLRIEKLDRGSGRLGVEVVRSKVQAEAADAADAPAPRVVFVANPLFQSPRLAGLIDGWKEDGAPLILCVGPHDMPAPAAPVPEAQRRVGLLAAEQNAWVLAAAAGGCEVVATRTELDWAMKNGQTCVWAPSKLVLDAGEGTQPPPEDPVALAAWLAEQFNACELVIAGDAAPESTNARVLTREETGL